MEPDDFGRIIKVFARRQRKSLATSPADVLKVAPSHRAWRRAWLQVAVLLIFALSLWCGWLVYRRTWPRVLVARLASFHHAELDLATWGSTRYVQNDDVPDDQFQWWQQALLDQPRARLLPFLLSEDPCWVWISAGTIRDQIRRGRRAGGPGRYEPQSPLDAASAGVILRALERDLPRPARTALQDLVEALPDNDPVVRALLIDSRTHRDASVRIRGLELILKTQGLEADPTWKWVETLAHDSDPSVRAALWNAVAEAAASQDLATLPIRYLQEMTRAAQDRSQAVRRAALKVMFFMEPDSAALFEVVVRSIRLLDDCARSLRPTGPACSSGPAKRFLPTRSQRPSSASYSWG